MSSGWNTLPFEIRWMIVDYIRHIIHPWSTTDPPCPALPLVCREWHGYFAHENFRILVLDQYRLNMFRELVDNSRIKYVERIVLRVQLLSYDCSVCEKPEDGKTAVANTTMFLDTLRKLTTILSSFDASSHPGIKLDLGVFSPSDGEHSFRECRFSRDYRYGAAQHVYKHHSQVLAWKRTQAVLSSSSCPGWKRVCDLTNPSRSEGSERRTYTMIGDRCISPACWSFYVQVAQFEPVPIISALVLRRHYHRHISPVYLAELIDKSLPKLQSFRHEVPLHASAEDALIFWEKYNVIFRAFPDTLNHLAIYQESEQVPRLEDDLDPSGQIHPRQLWGRQMIPMAGMIHIATRLTTLNAAFGVRAEEFLMKILELDLQLPKLEHMVLTSDCLDHGYPDDFLSPYLGEMIYMAGIIAYFGMPKLKSLVLWEGNSRRGYHVRFYYGKDRKPMMDWYCRGFRYQEEMFQAIRELFVKLGKDDPPRSLQVHHFAEFRESVPAAYPTDFPGVSEAIFDPESLRQMRFEREVLETNQHEPGEMSLERSMSSCILPSGR